MVCFGKRALSRILHGALVATFTIATVMAAAPKPLPDLAIEGFSVRAIGSKADRQRRVVVSFRIVNRGLGAAGPTLTLIQSPAGSPLLRTPALAPGASAFLSTALATSAAAFKITVTADVLHQLRQSSPLHKIVSYPYLASQPAMGQWRSLGPSMIADSSGHPSGVGRITSIAVDPRDTNTLYAGARGTGLWKTTDSGATWVPLTDALPTVNVSAVAVDPNNSMRVFVVSLAGIFSSTDGGQVWTLLNQEDLLGSLQVANAFFIHPVDPQRLYLATDNGLRISRDGGVTWSTVLGAGGVIMSLIEDSSEPDHLMATLTSVDTAFPATGVFDAIDGGLTPASWRQLQGCADAPLPAIPTGSQVSAWVAQSGVTQWVSIKNGPDHELWRTSSRACIVNGLFERNWEKLSSGTDTPCISPTSHWSFLLADPANPKLVFKAGVHLCRSTDGGTNFVRVNSSIHDDQHALVLHPAANGVMFLGNDGGLYRSDDHGNSWNFIADGLSVTEFMDLDIGGSYPRTVVGGSQDNALSAFDGEHPAWNQVDLGSDGDGDRTTSVIDPLDPDVQYTIGQAVDHFSLIRGGHRDESVGGQGLPTGCIAYFDSVTGPSMATEFIATTSTQWHLLTTVGPQQIPDGPNCNGGLWSGPNWKAQFVPPDGDVLVRVLHDPDSGLFVAGSRNGGVYINFSPDFMVKVWDAPRRPSSDTPAGSVSAIVRDLGRIGNFFVALSTPSQAGPGRVFEISPDGPLHFKGDDITTNLPDVEVTTLAYNPREPNALYVGTRGKGIFRGTRNQRVSKRPLAVATAVRPDCNIAPLLCEWIWQPFNNGIPQGALVSKLRVNEADGSLYAATYGRGAFTTAPAPGGGGGPMCCARCCGHCTNGRCDGNCILKGQVCP